MPATRVAVVDDHQLVRIGLKQIIESQPDFSWAGEAKPAAKRSRSCAARPVTCCCSICSARHVGPGRLRQIKTHHEAVATLVLSAYPKTQYSMNVLRAGASGFVSKNADDAELCRAIRATCAAVGM